MKRELFAIVAGNSARPVVWRFERMEIEFHEAMLDGGGVPA
jgi:hypothetical protein